MADWLKVLHIDELPNGSMAKHIINNHKLLLICQDGQYFCLKNECPHLGCQMHRGDLQDFILTCPCHDWKFDIRSGVFLAAPEITMQAYPVRVSEKNLYVFLGGENG